jgi:hypothetical protein
MPPHDVDVVTGHEQNSARIIPQDLKNSLEQQDLNDYWSPFRPDLAENEHFPSPVTPI